MVDRRTPVNRQRIYAGWACIAAAFALVVLQGLGIDLFGRELTAVTGWSDLWHALMPTVVSATGLFLAGLWLLKGPRAR